MAHNSLADLYVTGTEFTFTERIRVEQPGAEPTYVDRTTKVWLQKINDVDSSRAIKKANGAKARVIASMRDETSDEYGSCLVKAEDMDIDTVIDRLLDERRRRVAAAESSKLAESDEWSDDSYLEGLQQAWRESMAQVFLDSSLEDDDPDKVEATRVFNELQRFGAAAAAAVEEILTAERADLENEDEVELRERAIPFLAKEVGDAAWLREFNRCLVWLSTKVCTHAKHDRPVFHRDRVFETRADVDDVADVTFLSLIQAINALAVDPFEGKDLEETPASSSLSVLPEQPDQDVSSGPVAAAQ